MAPSHRNRAPPLGGDLNQFCVPLEECGRSHRGSACRLHPAWSGQRFDRFVSICDRVVDHSPGGDTANACDQVEDLVSGLDAPELVEDLLNARAHKDSTTNVVRVSDEVRGGDWPLVEMPVARDLTPEQGSIPGGEPQQGRLLNEAVPPFPVLPGLDREEVHTCIVNRRNTKRGATSQSR